MTILPGWDSLESTANWYWGFHAAALVFIFLLALTEILAFAYSGRADTLRAIAGSAGRTHPTSSRQAVEGAHNPGAFRAGNIRPSGSAGPADRIQSWPTTHQDCLRKETRAYRSSVGI